MPGPFYPPPPVFIGGRQPLAPRQLNTATLVPVNSPPRLAPISRAILALTVASWAVVPQPTQARPLAPPSGAAAATGPPPVQQANLRIIADSWTDRAVTVVGYSAFAPLLAPDWVQQPPRADRQLVAWERPFVMPPAAPKVVTSGAAQATQTPYRRDAVARTAWDAAWSPAYQQGRANIAPVLPVVSQPPVATYSKQYALRAAWDLPPPLPQGYAEIAPTIPAAAVPDWVPTRLKLESTLAAWIPAFQLPPRSPQAITSGPPGPPAISIAPLLLIRSMWEVTPPTPIQYSRAATLYTPAMPPYVRPADATVRASWDVPWNPAYQQGGSRLAPFIPAPAQPDWVPMPQRIERQLWAWQASLEYQVTEYTNYAVLGYPEPDIQPPDARRYAARAPQTRFHAHAAQVRFTARRP